MDWRESLADIFRRREEQARPGRRGSEEAVGRFLANTVVPAFEDLRTEFGRHGRQARLEHAPDAVALSIIDEQGREEFYYAVRAQAYKRMSFAFPEMDFKATSDARPSFRAEVVLRSGPTHFDVTGYTKEQVIRNFLHEYRKWVGWGAGG